LEYEYNLLDRRRRYRWLATFVFAIDLSLCMELKRIPGARLWFLAAMLLLVLFVIYTAVFSTGALLYPNLQLEQVLLHRPLTGIDCVLFEWRQFGEVWFSLLLTLALGIACLFLGYRRSILPCLLMKPAIKSDQRLDQRQVID